MTLDIDLGVDLSVVDEVPPNAAPTATDTGFLIHSVAQSGSPTGLTKLTSAAQARSTFAGEAALIACTDAWFEIGGAVLYVSTLDTTPADAVALFTDQLGPGQLMAPEVVTNTDQRPLRDWAWPNNRVYLASAPDGVDETAATALAAGLIDDQGGRNSSLWADTVLIPGTAPGTTREVSSAVTEAALMARSDIATGNPNLAAAGDHTPGSGGQSDYVVGIKNERPFTEIQTLARNQVNCYRTVNNRPRAYGNWTLADLAVLPQWWDISGARTVMAARAQEAAVAESVMFGEVDADGHFLDKYEGLLRGVMSDLQRIGAIYGNDQKPGYTVDVSANVNPTTQIAQGKITATLTMKTSPSGVELTITLTRKALS